MRKNILALFSLLVLSIASCGDPTPKPDGSALPTEVATQQPLSDTQPPAPPENRATPTLTKAPSNEKLTELPVNPAELKDETEGAAYIFALQDLQNDKSLVTKSATKPYLNQIAMLTRAYGLTGAEIGNAVLASAEVMDKSNADYKFSEILNAMLTLDIMDNAKLSELLATYAVFRSKGESHDDTVRQLHALLTALKDKRSELQDQIQPTEPQGPAG